MEITLEEAYNGSMKKIKIQRYRICTTCDGKGGKDVKTCKECSGRGIIKKMIQLGPGMYQHAQMKCSDCRGQGKVIKKKCEECHAEKIVIKNKKIEVPVQKGVPHEY